MPAYYAQRFDRSPFIKTVGKEVFGFYGDHFSAIQSKGLRMADITTYGTDQQIYLKSIFENINVLRDYFNDFQIIPKLLKVDRSKIKVLYANKLSAEEYFKYHYDNFVIRVLTSIDLWGKIGCCVYQLKIKNGGWRQFMQHAEVNVSAAADRVLSFSNYLDNLRKHRHAKVHTGKSQDNKFDKVIFWEDWMKETTIYVSKFQKDLANEMTDKKIQSITENIDKLMHEVIDHTVDFLETLTPRLRSSITR